MKKPKVVVVVGPTASGKSALAIEIAKQFSGEVISADSRQIYRGLDIGSAKVTEEEMQGVPHHLLDVIDLTDLYSAVDFKNDAAKAIETITKNSKLPIIAGGTFFYIDTLLNRISTPEVPANTELRKRLEKETTTELFEQLQLLDPDRAAAIDKHNPRRLIRAIEIAEALGSVPKPTLQPSPYETLFIGIQTDKEALRDRIAKRAPDFLWNGFMDEIKTLREQKIPLEKFKEFGFEYMLGLELCEEKITQAEFVQKFTEKNWQYAKRQLVWLKRDEHIEWFPRENSEAIFTRVTTFLNN